MNIHIDQEWNNMEYLKVSLTARSVKILMYSFFFFTLFSSNSFAQSSFSFTTQVSSFLSYTPHYLPVVSCEVDAGYLSVPRIYFDQTGNAAGNTVVDVELRHQNEPSPIADYSYIFYAVDNNLDVISRNLNPDASDGTTTLNLQDVTEDNYSVYGIIILNSDIGAIPNVGQNLQPFLTDIDNCVICADYVLGALQSDICVPPMDGNTPSLDGIVSSSEDYTFVSQYPFAAPLGAAIGTNSSDDIGENSAFLYYDNGVQSSTGFGADGDIQQFHITYDDEFVYLAITGPSAFVEDGPRMDEMDLFIAIDTDNNTGTGTSLRSSDVPGNKRIDFGNWSPDYFVWVETVRPNGTGLATVFQTGGTTPIATDIDLSTLTSTTSFDFSYQNEVTEIRIPFQILGSTPNSATGETWNFALYTTFDDDGYDAFDSAPAIGGGSDFEVLGDDPFDADYCNGNTDPVSTAADNGCMNCESDDDLGAGSDVGGMMGACTAGENVFPASDNTDGDFDTIEEYFQVRNIGQLEDVCCQNPEINTQPMDTRACEGVAAEFKVEVIGIDLTYQWQISSDGINFTNLTNDGIYSGTDTDMLQISNNTGLDGRFFLVEITSNGSCSVQSDMAQLFINPSPVIMEQPSNDIDCPGESAQFIVSASGSNLSYQWQSSADGMTWTDLMNGGLYLGVNTASLSIDDNSTLNGQQFRVVITQDNSPDPDCSTTSQAVTLIHSGVPLITIQPVDAVTCGGTAATFEVEASGNNVSYQWQILSMQGSWVDLPNNIAYSGVTTPMLTINDADNLIDRFFRVIVTENNSTGVTCDLISDPAQLVETAIDFSNCNNELNLTLGAGCDNLITPDLVLEGDYNHDDFTVELTDLDGNPIPNPVTAAFACTQVIFTVTDNCSGSSCWGFLNLEDKTDPMVTAPDDLEMQVVCDDIDLGFYTFARLNASNTYSVMDNCGPVSPPTIEFGNITGDICGGRQVVVTYTVTDNCGNTGSDTQIIFFTRPPVVIPSGSIEISCAVYNGNDNACRPFLDYDSDGMFDNNVDEYLQAGDLMCNYGMVVVLNEFDLCADGVKKVYSYTVFDWCAEDQLEPPPHPVLGNQANPSLCDIKVMDLDDPNFNCPNFFSNFGINNPASFITGDFDCTALVTINPSATDACGADIDFELKNVHVRNEDNDFELVDPELYTVIPTLGNSIRIAGLECDSYYAEIIAIDECGNSTDIEEEDPAFPDRPNCRYYFTIDDEAAPVAICDDNKSVSLNDNCVTSVPAEVFDSGSYDNCLLADSPFSVAKLSQDSDGDGLPEPNDFGPTVNFGASDLDPNNCPTDGIMVVLRVRDAKGQFSFCMVEVELEDKIAPECDGNESRNRSCADFGYLFDEETTDEQIVAILNQQMGQPGGDDNCGFPVTAIDITVTVTPSDCGEGVIRRRYRVEDSCGNRSGFCTQTLTISGDSDWKMTFPYDAVIECSGADEIPRPLSIDEILDNNGCDQWALAVDSLLFEFEEDACYKLIREYRFINWCTYTTTTPAYQVPRSSDLILSGQRVMLEEDDPGHNNAHIVYQQIIKVTEDTDPDIDFSYTENCDDDGDCEEQQIFDVRATDPCSPQVTLAYYFVGDLDNNGTAETSFQGMSDPDPFGNLFGDNIDYSIIGTYPLGQHQFVIEAEDLCGRTTTETFDFSVTDCEAPVVTCVEGFTANLTTDGTLAIEAEQFVEFSEDNCSDVIHFSFTANPDDEILQLDCDDLGSFSLNIFAFDENDNQGICSSFLILGPPTPNICGTGSGSSAIAGLITDGNNEAVSDVDVRISGNIDDNIITNIDGSFVFNNVAPNHDYSIIPEKNINAGNGVTTFDLVLIRKHILNLEYLDSPYKMIAADVNNSESISTFDMVILRKLILNITTEFENNTSWRFVDKNYNFPEPSNPWAEPFPEVVNVNDLPMGLLEANFVGIKIGDVNHSAIPNNLIQVDDRQGLDDFSIDVFNQKVKKGETVRVAFEADIMKVSGFQFTLNFDPQQLELVQLKENLLKTHHFGQHLLEQGILTASWNGDVAERRTLFNLQFIAKADGQLSDFLKLTSDYTTAEAYHKHDTPSTSPLLNVNLNFYQEEHSTTRFAPAFELFPNRPNPFHESSIIGFYLPKEASATLTILDVSGRVLKTITGHYQQGYNEISIQAKDLKSKGLLYYRLKTGEHVAARKMVLW